MNAVAWIELPVGDMPRAIAFYNQVMQWELQVMDLGQIQMAVFPTDPSQPGAGGALVQNLNYTPGDTGALIYFQCPDAGLAAQRVESAGGQVLRGKTQISPEMGYMALAVDTEGNRIALMSQQ